MGCACEMFSSGVKPWRESEADERRAQPVDKHDKIGIGDILK